MYLKLGLGLLLVGALYGVSQLPDYYRNQGAEAERTKIHGEIALAVNKAKSEAKEQALKDKLAFEIKYQESKNEYAKELQLTRDNAARSARLLFNKDRICGSRAGGESKGESGSVSDGGTSSQELFPEPYATNIKELMLQADLEMDKSRALQKVIKDSSCMVIVSDKAKE